MMPFPAIPPATPGLTDDAWARLARRNYRDEMTHGTDETFSNSPVGAHAPWASISARASVTESCQPTLAAWVCQRTDLFRDRRYCRRFIALKR
jgi:hypothetical protein